MSLPENLKQEAIRKYGRKFAFIYPKHYATFEDLLCGGSAHRKRANGYYAECTACGSKWDYYEPLPELKRQTPLAYGCFETETLEREENARKFTECPACGEVVEKRKGWYGKRGLKDRFYLQAWEVMSADCVVLHEAIVALDDWDNYRENGGARAEYVYDLRNTTLTPGRCETWKWCAERPMRVANVSTPAEAAGVNITHRTSAMASRGCYMGYEKLSGTFLRPFLEAVEKDPTLEIGDYAGYIIRMNEEPMTELLFKAGFRELTKQRVFDKHLPGNGTRHMDFTVRSPKKFFRGLKKNNAAQKMKELMRIVYPRNVTISSLEAAAMRFRDNRREKPEDLRRIVEAGSEYASFEKIWSLLPAFSSRRIGEYLDTQKYIESHGLWYYRDYLEMANDCGAPLNEQKTAFPKDLKKAHDEMQEKRKLIIDRITAKKFAKRHLQLVAAGFEYHHGGIYAVLPKDPAEIVKEGKALHHCVGGYVQRVADGVSNIVFIRHKDGKSWFTLEIAPKSLDFVQCYGDHNRTTGLFNRGTNYDPEVGKFLYHYRRHLNWVQSRNKSTTGGKRNGKQQRIVNGAA